MLQPVPVSRVVDLLDRSLNRIGSMDIETVGEKPTAVLCSGRYLDRLVRVDGVLKFREKVCVYDTTMVQGSIVFPI